MLTYTQYQAPKRKDRPWLLFIVALIWVLGTAFFHSPWEPYEPFVLAVVKGILRNHSWFVPYISTVPYLQIQPFYFWIYSALLKLFAIHNIYSIANTIRLLNTVIILAIVILAAKIGSNLPAFKNGRTVVLILISLIGFINIAYQLSPNILVLLGFCFYIYSLQLYARLPGISGWILFLGLMLVSISFSCEFIVISLLSLIILPLIDKSWRNSRYFTTVAIGITMFAIIFYLYCYQLQNVNSDFFLQWENRYGTLVPYRNNTWLVQLWSTISILSWYIAPAWPLVIWSIYKRGRMLLRDKITQLSIVLILLLLIFSLVGSDNIEGSIFPIILPVVFLASLEIDSMRISIVALLNWFGICMFTILGLSIWLCYLAVNLNYPAELITWLMQFTQDYTYHFNIWQLLLALLITAIWLFMITRRHIRGRELITNWASNTTFILILFSALCLPWFDSILSFKPIITQSLHYINTKECTVTNSGYSTQEALWYYYADINLVPSFMYLDYSLCNQAVIATEDVGQIDTKKWHIVWHGKRPIDKKVYYVLKR